MELAMQGAIWLGAGVTLVMLNGMTSASMV